MDFAFGWLVILPLAGIVIALFYGDDEYLTAERQHRKPHHVRSFFKCLGILILVGNIAAIAISWCATRLDTHNDQVSASICDISQQLGLVSDTPYPAEVGARIGGSYGNGYFWSGLFGGQGSVHIQPASALSVGFDYQGKSAILELPLAQTTFIKDANATTPSISIRLNCQATVQATQVVHLAPAHWRLDSGILMLVQDVTELETPIPMSKDVLANGLAPIVSSNLEAVEIRLSPELYATILG